MIKVINDGGRPWVVRLVFSGMAYGLDFKLTHDKEKPLVEFYDARFEQWLADGGRLFVVVGQGPIMEARRVTRSGRGETESQSLFETVMPPLIHAADPPKFVF